jgi:hypothetical protein
VALWLQSINLEEYGNKIIAYGYDSERALDMANEIDVVAMTEDECISMKKPHQTVFLKEWKARPKAAKSASAAVALVSPLIVGPCTTAAAVALASPGYLA